MNLSKKLWITVTIAFLLSLIGIVFFPHISRYMDKLREEKKHHNLDYLTNVLLQYYVPEKIHHQVLFYYLPELALEKLYGTFPGTIFIFKSNIPTQGTEQEKLRLLEEKISRIKSHYRSHGYPEPFFAIDQEGGNIRWLDYGTTPFPNALATAEANDTFPSGKITYHTGYYNCRELKQYGINWVLGPVADVVLDLSNRAIHARSFGNDPAIVADNVMEYLHGARDAGCMSALKHFPGHGDTRTDSHYALPVIHKPWSSLITQDLFPFIKAINSGKAPGVMTSHIVFPEMDDLPVTISRRWLTDILRGKYHFNGIIVTDDIGMNAMKPPRWAPGYARTMVRSIESGADMVLLFKDSPFYYRTAVEDFFRISQSPQEKYLRKRIQESTRRIIRMKLTLRFLDADLVSAYRKVAKENPQQAEEWKEQLDFYAENNEGGKNARAVYAPVYTSGNEVLRETARYSIKKVYGKTSIGKDKSICVMEKPEGNFPHCEKMFSLYTPEPITKYLQKNISRKQILIHNPSGRKALSSVQGIFRIPRRGPIVLYTTDTMLPAHLWKPMLGNTDSVITTFAGGDFFEQRLWQCFTEACEPPAALLRY